MNVRPDMLRPGMAQVPPSMMSLTAPQFMQAQQQPGQQSQPQNHMNVLPGANNSNPPMAMLGGGQPNMNQQQRFQLPMQGGAQQVNTQQRSQRVLVQQPQVVQGVGSSSGVQGAHMNPQLQNMAGFSMQQPGGNQQVRRVMSQPMNQKANHLGGLHPGQQAMSAMPMGMNPQTSMPGQLRQANNMRLQHQMQSPEFAMGMNRQGDPGLPQPVVRSNSTQTQLMGSLSQPPSLTSGGMQQPHSQNTFQNTIPLPHQHQQPQISSSPRPQSLPQPHTTPNMPMSTPGSSQTPAVRSQIPQDNPFMNFQNQFSQGPHSGARVPPNNSQFPFVPSSTPPNGQLGGDMSQSIGGGLPNPPGSANRASFHLTPAQQLQMQNVGDYGSHFNMPLPQSNAPPRPPSHNTNPSAPLPQQQQIPHQSSPHHTDHMSQPQRPQSQPQVQSGRPPSQSGPSHTPRSSQPQLPPNPGLLPPRMGPPALGGAQPPHSAQLPGSGPPPLVGGPRGSISGPLHAALLPPPADGAPPQTVQPQRPVTIPVGLGQGLVRLLQFSGTLASEDKSKLKLSYWNTIVKDYFTPKAIMKVTLWKDNQRNEAKPFEIGVPILPRFFLVTTQSGVKSMSLSLDGARERSVTNGHAVVECVTALWTYKYSNGYTVTLRGPLTCHVLVCPPNPPGTGLPGPPAQQAAQYSLKIENLQFDANIHDKYISLDSVMGQRLIESPKTPRPRHALTPTANGTEAQQRAEEDKKWEEPRVMIDHASIPGEPVNAFGIPQATMRCLELAESVGQMADLIAYSNDTKLGPIEALSKFALKIRESQPRDSLIGTINHNMVAGGSNFTNFQNVNGVSTTPAVTLYSPSANPPHQQLASSSSPPKNQTTSADNSPSKQNKPPPLSQGSGSAPSGAPATPAAGSGSSSHNTPHLSNASLKRKQSDISSPTVTTEQPPPKRATRKRGRTNG